jgi:serine/threonine-protein kinase
MGEELDTIAGQLGVPAFRVPAPRNSAQHTSAAAHHRTTRQLTRGPLDWMTEDPDPQYQVVSGQFAGIEMSEFALERQHARRMVMIWLAVVLAVTGLVAAVGWTIGNNLSGLL